MFKRKSSFVLCVLLLVWTGVVSADIMVLAAASLTNALDDIIKLYGTKSATKIKVSYAASSEFAKQIENGIPADVFISADTKWMDYLYNKGMIDGNTRINLLGNTLVLIAPKGKGFKVTLDSNSNLPTAFTGNLCTGETETVPVGKYAREALQNLKIWDALKPRIVGTDSVRSALAFVERGDCAAGIVYETDALISKKVEVVASFPESSHSPILYPAALVTKSTDGQAFLDFLSTPPATSVFKKYGFKILK
jgi:molybdate transport system substrate-binding protein